MSCNRCHRNRCTCPTSCGCLHTIPGNCTIYQGANLNCIDATKGDTYDDILANIDAIICELEPPSGISYIGTENEITVVGNVIGLDPTITTQLTNNQNAITALQAIAPVKRITTATPTYINISPPTGFPNGSGVVNINFIPSASPVSDLQGIVDNITTSTTLGAGYSYTKDFSSYGLKTGDVIKFKGSIRRTSAQTDEQTFVVTDNFANNTMVSPGGAFTISYPYSTTDFTITLSVVSNISNILTVKTHGIFETYVSFSSTTEFQELSRSDLSKIYQFTSNLALSLSNVRLLLSSSDSPVMEEFYVELIRKF